MVRLDLVTQSGRGPESDGDRRTTDDPLPYLEESPVRVCMQQTGQTRRECRDDIPRSNGLPPLP